MKPALYILITILLLSSFARAQNSAKEQAMNFVKTLKVKGVDTIICYHPYCTGGMVIITDTTKCQVNDTYYIIWADQGKNFLNQFDDCYTYIGKVNQANTIFKLLKFHFNQIKKEQIKRVSYWDVYKGKRQLMSVSIDHSCHGNFTFYIDSTMINKRINYFDLETKFTDAISENTGQRLNINYNYNQHTYLKRLLAEAEKLKKIKFKTFLPN